MRPKLNDPDLVRTEYADEARFSVRQATWAMATGPDVHDMIVAALRETSPRCVLEVGPGRGELAERIARELSVDMIAVDQSERMVQLTRSRRIEAMVGDVQELPFEDASFDAAVAAWMLYHVPDLDLAISELARTLRPGGSLVAVTNSVSNLLELWSLVGEGPKQNYVFGRENGEEVLRRQFASVDRRDADGAVTFPDRQAAHGYIAASPTRAHLADKLPRFEGPLVARRRVSVFVADKG